MSLRNALLALLAVEPMTGYDLYKRFETSVGYVWHAPDSQIYPELRRMEREGLVIGTQIPWGKRGRKTQYRITDEGTAAFREWMNTPLEYSRERDPVHLKAAYLEWAEPDAARAQLEAHVAYYSARRRQWEEMISELKDGSNLMLSKRLEATPAADHERVTAYKIFTYEGLVSRARAEIAWARRGLELVKSFDS